MKKIIIVATMALAAFEGAKAQFGQDLFNSSSQQLVEQAVDNGIVLLRQDYQLADTLTNARYGWNHQEVFNSIYSIGIKVEGGYVVTDKFIHPWNADRRYLELGNTAYVPVVSKSYFRMTADSVMTAFNYDPQYCSPLEDSALYRIDSIAYGRRGFQTDRTPGEKNGWLVWMTADSGDLRPETKTQLVIYRQKLTVEEDKTEYKISEPATTQHVIGGFYIVPQNTMIGVLDFQIIGYAIKKADDWYILKASGSIPAAGQAEGQDSLITPVPVTGDDTDNGSAAGKTKKKKKKQ